MPAPRLEFCRAQHTSIRQRRRKPVEISNRLQSDRRLELGRTEEILSAGTPCGGAQGGWEHFLPSLGAFRSSLSSLACARGARPATVRWERRPVWGRHSRRKREVQLVWGAPSRRAARPVPSETSGRRGACYDRASQPCRSLEPSWNPDRTTPPRITPRLRSRSRWRASSGSCWCLRPDELSLPRIQPHHLPQ